MKLDQKMARRRPRQVNKYLIGMSLAIAFILIYNYISKYNSIKELGISTSYLPKFGLLKETVLQDPSYNNPKVVYITFSINKNGLNYIVKDWNLVNSNSIKGKIFIKEFNDSWISQISTDKSICQQLYGNLEYVPKWWTYNSSADETYIGYIKSNDRVDSSGIITIRYKSQIAFCTIDVLMH